MYDKITRELYHILFYYTKVLQKLDVYDQSLQRLYWQNYFIANNLERLQDDYNRR